MATFNGAPYIAQQLNSLLAQSRLPDELVICDDHSSDETVKEIEKASLHAPCDLRLTVNPCNLGYAQNFGQALAACTGDLIFLSDQDDVWFPNKLAEMERLAANDPAGLMFLNDAEIVFSDLRPAGVTRLGQLRSAGLTERHFVTGCCSAVRRSLVEAVLPIPPGFGSHDIWLAKFADGLGRKRVLENVLQLQRRHNGNASKHYTNGTRRAHTYHKYLARMRRVRQRGADELPITKSRLELIQIRALEWLSRETDPALRGELQRFIQELETALDCLLRRMELRKLDRLDRLIQGARLLHSGGYRPVSGWVSYLRDLV